MRKLLVLTAVVFAGTGAAHAGETDNVSRMSDRALAKHARYVATHGGVFSTRHAGATRYMQRISYELVLRAFRPYGTQGWALCVVRRESGFNPGAVNWTYSNFKDQAQGLAQLIPRYHTWVDYKRMKSDPAYAVAVFKRLSRNGSSRGPWQGAGYYC